VKTRGLQVVNELRVVHCCKTFHCLYFRDDIAFNDKVGHEKANLLIMVKNMNGFLLLKANFLACHLNGQGTLIHGLQEAAPEPFVYRQGTANNVACDNMVQRICREIRIICVICGFLSRVATVSSPGSA
jgi:hypothetical protein